MQVLRNVLIIFLLAVSVYGCKKEFEGNYNNVEFPETYLVVDSIYRSGDNRYTTTVDVHWWGTVQSGFIRGYEVSVDDMQTWSFTTRQDSTFLLTLPNGQDTADIRIYVRTVDNRGRVDQTPASTAYPVRNTAPSIAFDYSTGKKTKAFPAFRFNWTLQDIDGLADISTVEIGLNDTVNTLKLPSSVTASTFVGERVGGSFTGAYTLYNNTQTTPFAQKLQGGIFDTYNFIYLRAVDRTGARSEWVKDSIFIKQPKNGLLFINDYNNSKPLINSFYASRILNLGTAYASFDTVASLLDELPSDVFTTTRTFEFFNRIVWVTEDPTRSLGTAQTSTTSFFNNGGKLFMVMEIPNDVQADAGFFSFTPMEKLVIDPGRSFRMATGDQLYAYDGTWPVLKASAIVTFPRPFNTYKQSTGLFSYDSLSRADLRSFGPGGALPWTGTSTVMSKRINVQAGKTDFITLTVPLHLMNANNNVDSFFKKVTVDELQF
jgi:hypothetical protein